MRDSRKRQKVQILHGLFGRSVCLAQPVALVEGSLEDGVMEGFMQVDQFGIMKEAPHTHRYDTYK